MNEIEQCTNVLLEAIRRSYAYADFVKSREILQNHPESRRVVDEFRRDVYLLQNSDRSEDVMDEMMKLRDRRQDLNRYPGAGEFLSAELRLCRILQKISMEVMNVTDVELDSFEDVIKV